MDAPLLGREHSPDRRPAADIARSIQEKLGGADNVLLVGVGGGNDSVTSLLLPAQFERDFGFRPHRLQVAAMLPDVLGYTGLVPLAGPIVSEITPVATRSVGGRVLKEFPEPLLAAHKAQFGIERVVGLSMKAGSAGLCEALHEYIEREKFDLVLGCDVGGDFIATPDNLDVLSPMMDSYALSVFRRLQAKTTSSAFLYCVFGLGTDGESTPQQLRAALRSLGDLSIGSFAPSAIADVNDFYRRIIEVNRRSRTADFTLRSIHGERLEPALFRARFHTQPSPGETKKYYGEFMHAFGEEFAGRYYLFEDLHGVKNPFEFHCVNGIEWFIGVQQLGRGLNHEMNGQSYSSIEDILGLSGQPAHSIFFGTPSFRFSGEQRREILADVASSLRQGVYDTALVLSADGAVLEDPGLEQFAVGPSLVLLTARGARLQADLLAELAKG